MWVLCHQQITDESHLLMICVDPKSQRKGIARQMMRDYLAHDTRQGCKHFFLEVRESNFPAQNLYKEFDFHVYSQRKNYYQHQEYKEDALSCVTIYHQIPDTHNSNPIKF